MNKVVNDATLGFKVRVQRQAHGLTQGELAAKVECHRVTIARIEGGHIFPSETLLEKIARAFGFDGRQAFMRWALSERRLGRALLRR